MGRRPSQPEIPSAFEQGIEQENNQEIVSDPPPRQLPPNPEVLKMDPMAELFGPGSTIRQIGDPDDDMPDEIRGVIEENGLAKRDFQCILKEIPQGSLNESGDGSANSVYVRAWKRAIPTSEYIAKEHGPGSYILVLSWRSRNAEGTAVVPRRETIPIIISEKCATEYRKYQLSKKINEASETGTKVRDALVEKTIEGQLISAITGKDEAKKNQTPKEYLEEIMSTVKMLGLPVGGLGAQPIMPKIEWDKVLPAVATATTALIGILQQASQRRTEEQNKLFMLLLSQNQNASSQLTEVYKTLALAKPTSADNPLKELQQMVLSAMDIKEMMNPPKETVADKIFRMVEMIIPQILTIAAQAQAAQTSPKGPLVDMAKSYVNSSPDFEKLKSNPDEMAAFVEKLDNRIGWENADVILKVVEWERPPECVRDPSKRYPPQKQAVDAETSESPTVDD